MKKFMIIALFVFSFISESGFSEDKITYSEDISKIFQRKCIECHQIGELAPMALTSYEEARPWVKSIREQVENRNMPPWDANPKYGKFVNDISLSQSEIDMIIQWTEQGALSGDLSSVPSIVDNSGSKWKMGEPDLFLVPENPMSVPVTGINEDLYQCIVLPYMFEEDKWINGIEYQIENRKIVHHVIGFTDVSGRSKSLDDKTPEPGFPCSMGGRSGRIGTMLGGWAPGMPPNDFPEGTGTLIEKGSYIVLQMHYFNQTDSMKLDASGIGIHFASEPVTKRARILPIAQWNLYIPAGDSYAEHKASWEVKTDIVIHTVMPHMHYIGKDMTVSVNHPDGSSEIILDVPRYDFNWQTVYEFVEPLVVPKGSSISMISHHDNSVNNPANPSDPPIDVRWGESTTEEMAIAWINYTNKDEDLTKE
jgi:hypothetical protein